jgi:glycosyltransferase involved in cell wall biosynthesis
VILEIFGRKGWGQDWEGLSGRENVVLHGYTDTKIIQAALAQATFYLAPSTAEGLGLPLLEVQHGGVTVIARDIPVFSEVLGSSGLLIDLDDVRASAIRILDYLGQASLPCRQASALENVDRWNRLAEGDQSHLFDTIFKAAFSGAAE